MTEGGRGGLKEGQAIWNKLLLLINVLINMWIGLESKMKRMNTKIIIIWLVFVSADGSWRLERGECWLGFVTIRKCGSGALYKLQLNGEVWKMSIVQMTWPAMSLRVSMGHMG